MQVLVVIVYTAFKYRYLYYITYHTTTFYLILFVGYPTIVRGSCFTTVLFNHYIFNLAVLQQRPSKI